MLEDLVEAVRRALDGGPAVTPLPRLNPDVPLPDGTALVVRTSGSTGAPREVALTADALRASATATHERLGGPGRWVLTLPATHVAGVQVIVRSVLAGTAPAVADLGAPFTADGLADLLEPVLAEADGPVYTSLVPTQLHRLVAAADDGAPRGLQALARCAAVLVGGAAAPAPLLERSHDAHVRVVRTYGMSETAGGCVYDGVPLPGVRVRIEPGSDVVELAGPMLAAGYVGDAAATAAAFRTDADGPDAGTRWFRTSDLGAWSPDGRLRVLGRADDVVVTGGVNVAPAAVEAELASVLPRVLGPSATGEACVVGVPDEEWGQAVVAVAVVKPELSGPGRDIPRREPDNSTGLAAVGPEELAAVRAAVTATLGAPSAPRRVYRATALPLRGPGKVDRAAVARAVRTHEAPTSP
ncbi:AMP-binding protein [Isoptericola variabilis]|uniref:O-succinylbenzoate--CoA ligase n=1 Tax=Isoptericola variabilis (strain 225) TaxID=743718 RepID=F6FUU9_ISOV2|nr:AMP-binding protein [Isoptericola variabilis]AEG43360.1 o-succinylbenzoate--CoA ligase [Isoptericola variabilis 225]TWH34588.1 O-succinylbenzoic acid--CoA ligase [Isoptericola variabilis J7]